MAKQVDSTYGNALFELAVEENKVDELFEEVVSLVNILDENQDLINLLSHPQIDKEEKKTLIENVFSGKISDELTGLMIMIMEKDHSLYIKDVFGFFINQVKKYKNIGVASVTSAIDLTDAQKDSIEKRLIETTSYDKMEIEYSVDKSIIGGLVIRIEDRIVDSSIKTKIASLSKTLANS